MVVDSSALIAILLVEPGSVELGERMGAANRLVMSAANWLECAMVMARLGQEGQILLDRLVQGAPIEVLPVTVAQAALAREAFLRFGKGSGSAARLNFGDCFAYALAKSLSAPLLYRGDDFAATDIVNA